MSSHSPNSGSSSHTVRVEQLLDGEPVGHGDHEGGERAQPLSSAAVASPRPST